MNFFIYNHFYTATGKATAQLCNILKVHLTLSLLLFLFCAELSFAQPAQNKSIESIVNVEKLNKEKGKTHYSLGQIIELTERSVELEHKIVYPSDLTEFERVLFRARELQHQNDQFLAIQLLSYLLEFKYYRTEEEALFIKLLIGSSLDYIGAPIIGYAFMKDIFPQLLEGIEKPATQAFVINRYTGILMKIDSVEKANRNYRLMLDIYNKENDSLNAYNTRNNYGFSFYLLQRYDSARFYYKINQQVKFKYLNPILYAFSFGNYSSVLGEENKTDSAIYYALKEISMLKSIGSDAGLENTYLGLGKHYETKQELDSACKYYKLSLATSKKKNFTSGAVKAYESMLTLYAKNQKDSTLEDFLNDYFNYNDSLKENLRLTELRDELGLSRFLKIFRETEQSKKRYDKLETRNRELIFIAVALGVFASILFLVLIWRKQNRKKLAIANEELLFTNEDLKKSYETISVTNQKNELLLKELHHRVKNNLQVISSLFSLQLNLQQLDNKTMMLFQEARDRIHSISLIHKKIYQSDNIDRLDFGDYLASFSQEMNKINSGIICLNFMVVDVVLSIDYAIPLGLIFNELFTNSIKHAKTNQQLELSVYHEKNGNLSRFVFTDNGQGVDPNLLNQENTTTIGITLIRLLSKQLEAKVELRETKPGVYGFWFSIEGIFD